VADGRRVGVVAAIAGGTTDVGDHPEFADRKRTVMLDGVSVSAWWRVHHAGGRNALFHEAL
jgi:hypothetical protein